MKMDPNLAAENWHEICFFLSDNVSPNTSEKEFENQVLRAIEILGWREFKGEIERQPTVHIGRQGALRPDFIIYNQERKALIVVEVKRPAEDITKDDTVGQLRSYMRQMKSEFGFLIGSEFRIYYDGSLNPQSDPLLLEKIPFDKNAPAGKEFIGNFNKNSFLNNEYCQYLEGKIKKFSQKREIKKLIDILLSETTREKIYKFLEKEYTDFGHEIFSAAIKDLSIYISRKQYPPSHLGKAKGIKPQIAHRPKKKITREIQPVQPHILSTPHVSKPEDIARIPFESNKKIRLRHIYGVIYFMKLGYDFSSATHATLNLFPDVRDYQTICDKCARCFAGNVDTFVNWFNSGEILNQLLVRFGLSDHDYGIFKQLLSS